MYHVKQQAVYSKNVNLHPIFLVLSCHIRPIYNGKVMNMPPWRPQMCSNPGLCRSAADPGPPPVRDSSFDVRTPAKPSDLPGSKAGVRVVLLTMTVILDLREQRGRSFKTSSPFIQVKQDYGKSRQVCSLEEKLLLTDAPGVTEPVKSRTTRHHDIREPSNPSKAARPVHYLVPTLPSPSACTTT